MTFQTYDQLPKDKNLGPTVLIVDDEELSRRTVQSRCSAALKERTFRMLECDGIAEAAKILAREEVHVVLLDKNLGPSPIERNHNGIDSIPFLLSLQPHLQILMITSSVDKQDIVAAMRNGAFGFVNKGDSPELIIEQIKNAVRYAMMSLQALRASEPNRAGGAKLVGDSEAVGLLRRQVETLARTETPVLLTGETGTGKTTVAELMHSLRQIFLKDQGRPFIHLNMSAIPENLAESELFGSERGAFTGSIAPKQGKFELAHGGTLFLDEIGDASPAIQSKLLTVLDKGKYTRLGGSQERFSQFRLICATNKNLEDLVKAGEFREDLFMRISTITIRVPSIVERREDIPQIVESVLPKCAQITGIHVAFEELPSDFVEYLKDAPIQGNIRGIEQQIQRLLLFSPQDKRNRPVLKYWRKIPGLYIRANEVTTKVGGITFEELTDRGLDVVGEKTFLGLPRFLDHIKKLVVADAHRKLKGNAEIAKALDVSTALVSLKLADLGLRKRQLKSVHPLPTSSESRQQSSETKEGVL